LRTASLGGLGLKQQAYCPWSSLVFSGTSAEKILSYLNFFKKPLFVFKIMIFERMIFLALLAIPIAGSLGMKLEKCSTPCKFLRLDLPPCDSVA